MSEEEKTIRYLSVEEAQTVSCPQCGAAIGVACVGVETPGATNHARRVNSAATELGVVLPHQRYKKRRRGGRGRNYRKGGW